MLPSWLNVRAYHECRLWEAERIRRARQMLTSGKRRKWGYHQALSRLKRRLICLLEYLRTALFVLSCDVGEGRCADCTQSQRAATSETGTTRCWRVRSACYADCRALVDLRRALFRDMGYQDEVLLDCLTQNCASYFATALPRQEFRAWVAEAGGEIVACGGVVIHYVPPTTRNLQGREAYIMNMYTRPGWRRQGIGTAILQAILDHLRTSGITVVSLHATDSGRSIYKREGFEPSSEMRLQLESRQS
jgi:GNAT superfamily N-acetyltransferase